jgi:polyhydroxyalkanoate synthase
VAVPGKLVRQIIECLYRNNRLFSGSLQIGDRLVGPATLDAPVLAVVNTADDVAPMVSVKPFTDALSGNVRILDHPGEIGVCLQHLAILVGREAKVTVWPEIIAWIRSCASVDASRLARAER